jgi:2-polyprenyl-6-methoxyphenol hydroxylase-like FAD-dependent oxidoreductase
MNHGILDVVSLINELQSALKEAADRTPTTERMNIALEAYQKRRFRAVEASVSQSGMATAQSAWKSTTHKLSTPQFGDLLLPAVRGGLTHLVSG